MDSNEDFYLEQGRVIFTRHYHLKRGHCCGNKCRHCPYDGRVGSTKQKTPVYTKNSSKDS